MAESISKINGESDTGFPRRTKNIHSSRYGCFVVLCRFPPLFLPEFHPEIFPICIYNDSSGKKSHF